MIRAKLPADVTRRDSDKLTLKPDRLHCLRASVFLPQKASGAVDNRDTT